MKYEPYSDFLSAAQNTCRRRGECIMAKHNKRQQEKIARANSHGGLSLEKFAKAKSSKYDKRARAEAKRELRARQLAKFRKLKSKLEKLGRLEPLVQPNPKAQVERGADADIQRAIARAGPAQDLSGSNSPDQTVKHSSANRGDEGKGATRRHSEEKGEEKEFAARDTPKSAVQQQQPRLKDSNGGPEEHKPVKRRRHKRPKPESQLQRLAAKVQVNKDKKQAQKAEAQKAAVERKQQIARTEKQRNEQKSKFFKRTKSGQPVMKHRVDKLLSKLEAA